jgi:hypothetical protein
MAGVGRVTVSLRRSITSGTRRPYAALDLYGASGAALRERIAPVLAAYPLAQGCPVVDL